MDYKRLKKDSLDALLNSDAYKYHLSELLIAIIKGTQKIPNESSLATFFENQLYYFIKSFFGVDVKFTKEVGESIVMHKFTGRMDALSNDLIIEYKHYTKLQTDKDKKAANDQVKSYIEQLYREGLKYKAIITDGRKIKYLYYHDGDTLIETQYSKINIDDLDSIIKALLSVKQKKFVPENIVSDFSLRANNGYTKSLAKCLFQHLIHSRNVTEKSQMLFEEWEVLFHLSENDKGQNADIVKRRNALSKIFGYEINDNESEYKSLFALQTSYAIIVKLIACKAISKLTSIGNVIYFSDLSNVNSEELRSFFEKLEDGYIFSMGGIRNLLEGDFFSWYCSEEQWSQSQADVIIDIIKTLDGYMSIAFNNKYEIIDIFKDLYMEIIPAEVRHSLGEYFTPAWLSDYIVKKSITKIKAKKWVGIDPCCGSGVFLISMIKAIIKDTDTLKLDDDKKEILLTEILSRVIGIDMNPLSVLTSRVSYFLAISTLRVSKKIDIPVYLGDSANIPQRISLDGVACYKYELSTQKGKIQVILPCSFVHSSSFISKINQLQIFIKAEDVTVVYDSLLEYIPDTDKNDKVIESLKLLSKQLVELHINKWDGIWVRIVTNFMLVAKISNIDIIVGNPPWIKWEYLPQQYAEKIKNICVSRHLFSGQHYVGAISLNICALIANVTASTWLNKDGVLAFLMPRTLMTQDSYAGFRNFYVDYENNRRLYLQDIDDWSKAGNPFIDTQEKFLTYYYKSDVVDYFAGIPVSNYVKHRGINILDINKHKDFDLVKEHFDINQSIAYQLDSKRTGFTFSNKNTLKAKFEKIIGKCEYKARSGTEFTPAEVYFIESVGSSGNKNTYIFRNSKFKISKYKVIENDGLELETKYVRPVIKGPNIERFRLVDSNAYCIFPYNHGETDSVLIKDLSKDSPLLTNYLIEQKALIQKQSKRSQQIMKGDDFYSLSKVGLYSYGKYAVAFRDNTVLNAVVIESIETPWGETVMPVCAKHSPFISMDKKNNFITKDEAYFICGILNTEIVREYFKSTYCSRSFSINFNIKLPKYNEKNSDHIKISELSKRAHTILDSNQIENLAKDIEKKYLRICDDL